MRFALVGDIVGKEGVRITVQAARWLKEKYRLDLLIANAENAYNGSGLSPGQHKTLIDGGVDLITLGDHAFKKREIFSVLRSQNNIVRPANFPNTAPGAGFLQRQLEDGRVFTLITALGRIFTRPVDCPFVCIDQIIEKLPLKSDAILVDFHAEATSEKQTMGYFLDGKVSAVLGTHTHVATADECIQFQGTAFQCDVGMTGPHNGIIGRNAERVLETTVTFQPRAFTVADGDFKLNATIVETNENSILAKKIERISITSADIQKD